MEKTYYAEKENIEEAAFRGTYRNNKNAQGNVRWFLGLGFILF